MRSLGILSCGLLVTLTSTLSAQERPAQTRESHSTPVDLPEGLPDRFTTELRTNGRSRQLDLERVSFRADGFRVRAWVADGELVEVPAAESTTYVGGVFGEPETTVVGRLTPAGLRARIDAGDGDVWLIEPAGGARRALAHTVVREDPASLDFGECGADLISASVSAPMPGADLSSDLLPLDCLKQAEIAFDADFEFYQDYGSSIPNTVARIEEIVAQVNLFYARDVKIVHQLTEIVVRTAPFYTPTSGGSLLTQFRNRWNNNMQDVPRDITHLMTGKPGSLIEFGGLAYVGVVCTNSQYGWSMDGANIVGHEVGHNWGAPHCLDPSPCNNMCGACFLILPNTKRVIENHRDSRNCLDDVGPFFKRLPPYVAPELVTLNKSEYASSGPIEIDVLANDHDGNCQWIRITDFDPVSSRGASISLVPAAGLLERDRLVYTPTSDLFVGEDTFSYVVGDSSGQETQALQRVVVDAVQLRSYWPFDETSGDTAADATGNGNDAQGQVAGIWAPGVLDGALEFDGNQLLDTGMADLPRPWTVATWVRRRAGAVGASSIIESSNGSLRIKQGPAGVEQVGVTRYGDIRAEFNYIAPTDTWVHLTFVGDDNGTTLWVDGQFQDTQPVYIRAPTGTIGRDVQPLFATLDDLRIYDYGLSANEISDLFASGGRAEVPVPADGAASAFSSLGLQWLPAPGITSHDVYFGTTYADVAGATPASSEFQGNVGVASFIPSGLVPGVPYYWRVDEVGGATVVGDIWQFSPVEWHRWRLDETSGGTAADSEGGHDTAFGGGVVLGEPGATGVLGTSVYLDGIDDQLNMSALNLDTDRLTISCWLKRDGSQPDFAGVIFTRAGNSTAGLNFGTDDELRYHWNGSGSSFNWDSGLVAPVDEWVFVALVVEPDQATMYLGQSGGLTSSVNSVGHGVEEFDGPLFFGRDPGFGNRDFKGHLDDVRIYDSALTTSEINTLYALSQ